VPIKHTFPAQRVFEGPGGQVDQVGVVIGALDGGLRGNPWPGAPAVHANKRRRVAKVDDNGGAGANLGYQFPPEPPIVLYLVRACHSVLSKLERALSASPRGARLSDQDGSDEMRLKPQPLWSLHALSNSADATSTVSLGQPTASSNGVAGTIDPTDPLSKPHWGQHSIPQYCFEVERSCK